MRSPSLLPFAFCFTLGTSCLWLFQSLPNVPHAWLFSLCAATVCLFYSHKQPLLAYFCAVIAGLFYCLAQSQQVLEHRLPNSLEGIPLTVIGRIISIPEGQNQNWHFEFLLEKIQSANTTTWVMPEKIRLSWYQTQFSQTPKLVANLKPGDTWQFTIKLKQARSTFNPDSFDYEAWLFARRITAIGSIVDKSEKIKLSNSFWQNAFDHWRENINNQLNQSLTNNTNLGLIEALAIGVRDNLSSMQWQIMQATGTNHLVAIAGLHVGFVVAFVYASIKFIWRRIPKLVLFRPAHDAAICFALLAAFYYSALAGFALPTKRALIMLSIALLANLLRRNLSPWQTVSAALIAILIYDPLSVFTETFWLSFIAVAVILFGITGRKNDQTHWQQSLKIQWIVAVGLAPITLYFFHEISLINLMANGIAIPWIAFIALPLILFGILLLPFSHSVAHSLWWLAAKSLTFYWPVLSWLASLDRLQWQCYLANTWQLALAMIGMIIFLAPKGFPGRYFGLFGFLPLLFPTSAAIKPNDFKITQLDVGQGLATMIQTTNHIMVFDTGPKLDDSYDMGQSVVVPALRANHIKQLDLLVISHGDNDHSGGANAVLQALPVKTLLTSVPALYAYLPAQLPNHLFDSNADAPNFSIWLAQKLSASLQQHWLKPIIMNCEAGQHWKWDGVDFNVLSPAHDYYPRKGNDRSCVIRVANQFHSLLLTGDIEKRTEKILVANADKKSLKVDVIVAPHHGSKTSSCDEFVNAVHPSWVFYATGYRNRFHFPHPEVLARYQAINAASIDTAKDGQVQMQAPNQEQALTVIRTRALDRHFWNFA